MNTFFNYHDLDISKYSPTQFDFDDIQLTILLQLFSKYQHHITKSVVTGHSQFCECIESFLKVSILSYVDIVYDETFNIYSFIAQHFKQSNSIEIMRCPHCLTWTVSNYF